MYIDPTILQIGEFLSTIGGAWLFIRKIAKDNKVARKEQAADILQSAKEEDKLLKAKLEARIDSLETELKNLESNVAKDLAHTKEAYTAEIKNLGEKIEQIRTQLNDQHSQLLAFLTRLVEKQ